MNINRSKNCTSKRLAGVISTIAATTLLSGVVGNVTAWADTGGAGDSTGETAYAPDPTVDPIFIKVMRSPDSAWPATTSDADLIKLGHDSCTALGSGQDLVQDVALIHSESPNASLGSVGYLIGASTVAYCPAQMQTVKEQAQLLADKKA
jgi:Protein of unknown function (DUF732)